MEEKKDDQYVFMSFLKCSKILILLLKQSLNTFNFCVSFDLEQLTEEECMTLFGMPADHVRDFCSQLR